jgi:hypothetical protein
MQSTISAVQLDAWQFLNHSYPGGAMQLRLPLSCCAMLCTALILSGCERIGIADPVKEAANRESDARATGGACRHAGRALEDCYAINPDAGRAAVFAGWKEMNDYMRENKIEDVKPVIAPNSSPQLKPANEPDASASAGKNASAH